MESDDVYRSKLLQLTASLKAWSGFIGDVARFHLSDEDYSWRLLLEPKATRACPLELVIEPGTRSCDLTIGGQTYENWRPPSLELVLPLVVAVTEGRVVTRHLFRSATGMLHAVSSIVSLEGGKRLEFGTDGGAGPGDFGFECREVHYVPYRKPGAAA